MKLDITHIGSLTPDSITLRFKKPANWLETKPGQFGVFNFSIGSNELTRNYSFHTTTGVDDELAITVRAVSDGKVSNYLLREANDKMFVDLVGVGGNFFVEPLRDNARQLVMIAGGSGITPIMSMIKGLLYHEPYSNITLIYANTSYDRILFKNELASLEDKFSERFKTLHVISQKESVPADFSVYYFGRLSKLVVKKTIKSILDPNSLPKEFFICGPNGLMELVNDSLQALSIDTNTIHQEHFFVPDKSADDGLANLPAREVIVRLNDFDRLVTVASGESILDASLKTGLKLLHSCKEGACGTCKAILISGDVKLRKNYILTEDELKNNHVLLCQGFPISDDVVVKPMSNL